MLPNVVIEYSCFLNSVFCGFKLFPPVSGLQGTKAAYFFLPLLNAFMDDTQHSPPESSLHGRDVFGKSNLHIAVHGDTDVHDSLDPIYVAKANILNDAFREIGMGRYQVGLFWTFDLCVLLKSPPIPQWFLFIVTGFGWLSYVLLFPALCFTSTSPPLWQ